jgi:hypothetical protein
VVSHSKAAVAASLRWSTARPSSPQGTSGHGCPSSPVRRRLSNAAGPAGVGPTVNLMTGRKPRLVGDSELAHDHGAGATVLLSQILAHDRLGAISVHGPFRCEGMWAALYDEVGSAFDEFEQVEEELTAISVGADSMRDINDPDFIASTYRSAVRAVVCSVLALQHLTAEIGATMNLDLGGSDLDMRVSAVARALGFESHADIAGWDSVHELEQLRHAIEHPEPSTLYSADWAKVPRAWMFSDRPLKVRAGYREFFETVAERWLEVFPSLATSTVQVKAVRGIRSTLQFKKGPNDR